ncbi:hypothetical protein pb186bvf_008764 [Paramecium bursaria]
MNDKINELSKDFSQLKYDLFLGYNQKYRFYGLCVFTGLNITIAAFMKKRSKLIQTGLFSFLGYGFFIYPELYINLLLKENPPIEINEILPLEINEIPHYFIKRE